MSQVLIVDDDSGLSGLLSAVVNKMGHQSRHAGTAREGLELARAHPFEVVLLDVGLPDGDGMQKLPLFRESPSAPEVIIITGLCSPDAAELAIRGGAWDYLVKPASVEDIMLAIRRALVSRERKSANPLPTLLKREDIAGSSAPLQVALERVAQAAAVESNVLICGETGTGKELLARAVHANSSRRSQPFVVVDCASLPESLVESVLFGHAKGAFTGAEKERDGLIRQAHGGTLFLDEVGEMPLSIQKTFLRVIQERRFRPVSGRDEIEVDFRLVAATNRDLDAMAAEGDFRRDLLFRLRSFTIEAPPLRARNGDLKLLAMHCIHRYSDIYGTAVKGLSSEFLEALQRYHWPGNVRELFHTLEEALTQAGSEPTLYPYHLPLHIRAILTRLSVKARAVPVIEQNAGDANPADQDRILDINTYRNQMELRYLEHLTHLTNGNRKKACRLSGLSRTRLFELLKKHGLGNPAPALAVVRWA
jgi:two-component system NtrC family response regulator